STPTDAARRIVPDVVEEFARIRELRARAWRLLTTWLDRETLVLQGLRARPVLSAPEREIDRRREEVVALTERSRRCLAQILDRAQDNLDHQLARVRALSP